MKITTKTLSSRSAYGCVMTLEIVVDDTEVYDTLPTFEWEKYQAGFLGILNNAYNQSCNCGTKVLGDMSEITSAFSGGSYDDFIDYYYSEHDGMDRRRRAIKRMAENIIKRVRAVGGDVPKADAMEWAKQYIEYMLVNSYRGFLDEERAIELVADELDSSWTVAGADVESDGIDGYIGGESVQVKPETYSDMDINSFDTEHLIVYQYDDDQFYLELLQNQNT